MKKTKDFLVAILFLSFGMQACASNDTTIHSLSDINEFGALQKQLLSNGLNGFRKKIKGNIEGYSLKAFDKDIVIEIYKQQNIPAGINSVFIEGKQYKLTSDNNKYLLIDNLSIYSLTLNKSKFICVYSGYTPCNSYNCRKVRFNLFEIGASGVKHLFFDNVFGDINIFGDVNSDGNLDVLSTIFSDNTSNEPINYYDYITISVASIKNGKLEELRKGEAKYFMDVKFDPEKSGKFNEFMFTVINSSWFKE
jgi:hypothetical protein